MADIGIPVPGFGESITEATIASWFKNVGDHVLVDEPIAELETDKVSVELLATETGILSKINSQSGDVVKVGDIVAFITPGPAPATPATDKSQNAESQPDQIKKEQPAAATIPPAASKIIAENNLEPSKIQGTGKHGQITKADALKAVDQSKAVSSTPSLNGAAQSQSSASMPVTPIASKTTVMEEKEEIVPMSRVRQVIAKRLVQAQQTAAILTTFNEIDMKALMDIRKKYKDQFLDKYGIKPGFMSFFTKASIEALKAFPAINAEIRDTDIVYKKHFHIGIAVGGPKGLVVPVVKHADHYSLAEIELEIARLASQVKDSTIPISALEGGTFTISNGGVYGSMLSTPILNPPQTGILGMHNIVERPVAVNGEVLIRPVMFLALSYDHRMVDGKEAVQFLVKIKELLEDPVRLLLEV